MKTQEEKIELLLDIKSEVETIYCVGLGYLKKNEIKILEDIKDKLRKIKQEVINPNEEREKIADLQFDKS